MKYDWKDITVKQFLRFEELSKRLKNKEIEELDFYCDVLTTLTNIDYTRVPISKLIQDMELIAFINEPIPEVKRPKSISINGHDYEVRADLNNIQTSQFADFNNIMKNSNGENAKMMKALSVVLIPKGKKNYGEDYDIEQVIKDIDDMPYMYAQSIAFFLHKKYKRLCSRIQNYLIVTILTTKMPLKKKIQLIKDTTRLNSMASSLI